MHISNIEADLTVGQVSLTPTITQAQAGTSFDLTWTVVNISSEGTFTGDWTDRVYLYDTGTQGLIRMLGDFPANASLARDVPLTRTQTVTIPIDLQGDYRLVVTTDAYNQVIEGIAGERNNSTTGTEIIHVLPLPSPNLHVDSITSPASSPAGRQTEIQWEVKNTGEAPTTSPVWYDQIWLSADDKRDSGDISLGTAINPSYLDVGQGYINRATINLPANIEGDYHILVKTDTYNQLYESHHENDNILAGSALKIEPIPLSELSDLAVASVGAPSQALSGQRMSITYTIDNAGQAAIAANTPEWIERIYMSSDAVLDSNDRLLNTIERNLAADQLPLPNGQTNLTATESVTLPVGVSGDFYFFVTVSPVAPVTNVFTSNDKDLGAVTK